ncbi:MAG: ABC transporter ATP-binding protein [Odoribacter sp.]|nr:ABC transporter ATP-binding protein [Odoribacter sp.]
MEENKEILSFKSLLIGYTAGKTRNILLPPFSASAYKSELIAIIGQNGIGKSTLLRTITGLQNSQGGTININGKSISSYSRIDFAQCVGFVSTEPVRVSNMKVYDLVALGRFPHTGWFGKLTARDHEIVMDAIEKAGMPSFINRYINELSDGERQRVMIARVLAQDTDILVLDEPTAFLDIKSKYEIIHLLHDLAKKRGKTIIFSTHDLNSAVSEADKIWLILKDLFREGAPEDLIIGGDFDELFKNSLVRFNQTDGSFTFRNEFKGIINVRGEGISRLWTEKALNRAGYSVSTKSSELEVAVINGPEGTRWILESSDIKEEYNSVYELVSRLTGIVK